MNGWEAEAACRGTPRGTMFPDLNDRDACEAAIRICGGCPVVIDCGLAGRDEAEGVWGGVLHRPRAQGRKKPRYEPNPDTGLMELVPPDPMDPETIRRRREARDRWRAKQTADA